MINDENLLFDKIFCPKQHDNKRNWTKGRVPSAPLDLKKFFIKPIGDFNKFKKGNKKKDVDIVGRNV